MQLRSLALFLACLSVDSDIEISGPGSWGNGLNLGPAFLEEKTSYADQWRAGVSPERARFSRLGGEGAPSTKSRQLAQFLAQTFDCRVCQALIKFMWQELDEPSQKAIETWLYQGCVPLVKQYLVLKGWQLTREGCGGAGVEYEGEAWCMLKDVTSEIFHTPELCEVYEPQSDALYLACERTLGAHSRSIALFLMANRNGTPARARNEYLAYRTCQDSAFCGGAPVPAGHSSACTVPSGVSHSTSCGGQRIESGGSCYPACEDGYKPTVTLLSCRNGELIPNIFACLPIAEDLPESSELIRAYPGDGY